MKIFTHQCTCIICINETNGGLVFNEQGSTCFYCHEDYLESSIPEIIRVFYN